MPETKTPNRHGLGVECWWPRVSAARHSLVAYYQIVSKRL